MADCECLETCVFFNDQMANMPNIAEMQKDKYCRKDNSACARYMVFKALGKQGIPANLFPINVERAKEIIDGGKR